MRFFGRIVTFGLLLAIAAGGFFGPRAAQAGDSRTLAWAVSVTYQNVGTADTPVLINFYPEGSATAVQFDPLNGGTLAAGAGKSFFIGNVSGITSPFRGAAVVSAEQPLVATVVQSVSTQPNDGPVRVRLLSNGFQASDASNQYLIATALLNKFNRNTVFSIQNTESFAVNATVQFYDADVTPVALVSTVTHNIPAQSSKYIDMTVPANTGLPAARTVLNGSAVITAVKADDAAVPGKVVSAASEYFNNQYIAANFEGVPLSATGTTIYMATALCKNSGIDTSYAIQNSSLSASTFVKVQYVSTTGQVFNRPAVQVGPGGKDSAVTCADLAAAGAPNGGQGFTGAAIVTSTTTAAGTTAGAPLAVIGKARGFASGSVLFTAFLGQAAGYSKLALPFVRWAKNTDFNSATNIGARQRATLAIQNLENTAVDVDVEYYDKNGALVATHQLNIPANAKANSNASLAGALDADGQFGYYNDGSFGGAVIIKADAANPTAKLIAIARLAHPNTALPGTNSAEDYNAVPVP